MKKKQGIDTESTSWNMEWGPEYGNQPPPQTKQETLQDSNDEPYTGMDRIAFRNKEGVWVFKWSKLNTDKKKRSIDHWQRRGEQTRWEDMIYE